MKTATSDSAHLTGIQSIERTSTKRHFSQCFQSILVVVSCERVLQKDAISNARRCWRRRTRRLCYARLEFRQQESSCRNARVRGTYSAIEHQLNTHADHHNLSYNQLTDTYLSCPVDLILNVWCMVDHSLQKIEDQCPRSLKDSGEVYRAVIAEGLGWGVTGMYVCM